MLSGETLDCLNWDILQYLVVFLSCHDKNCASRLFNTMIHQCTGCIVWWHSATDLGRNTRELYRKLHCSVMVQVGVYYSVILHLLRWGCRYLGLGGAWDLRASLVMSIPWAWTWAFAQGCLKHGCMDEEGQLNEGPGRELYTVITTLSGSTCAVCWAQISLIGEKHSPEGRWLKRMH